MTRDMSDKRAIPRILIVDDTEENVQVASFMLQRQGYRCEVAGNGQEALDKCRQAPPDLVLLDIMMPIMDGYECCRQLKADDQLKDIPVIFLSAMADTDDVVNTHLRLRRLQVTVEKNYRDLSELEEQRDNLVHMIIHDLRTPLSVVQGNLDLVENCAAKIPGFQDFQMPLHDANQATVELIHMVSNLLDISRMEDGKMPLNLKSNNLAEMLGQCGKLMSVKAEQKEISLTVEANPIELACDSELIQRVLVNLTANAIKFSPPESSVRISSQPNAGQHVINVVDSGPGVPPDYQSKVFEKFGQVDAYQDRKKFSTGLGLTFCKLAIEAHGGDIGVESDGEHGSRFWFSLPVAA